MKISNKDLIECCISEDATKELIILRKRLLLCGCDMCKRGIEMIDNYFDSEIERFKNKVKKLDNEIMLLKNG